MNGIKYFILSTAVLFAVVFALTGCEGDDTANNDNMTETVPAQTESQLPAELDSKLETEDEEEYYVPSAETVSPDPDPADADNTWALFLVNEKNPLPRGYDEKIELEIVDTTYKDHYMDSRMAQYMKDMIAAAKADGIELTTASAFRDFAYQKANFDNSVEYRMEDGMTYEEARIDTIHSVQLPGQSEHNAGLAADILSDEYSSMDDDGFENTEAFKWLSEHAAEYGFILRYPKGKIDVTGIIYEPWHYRFVGKYYANEIKNSGLTMEEYFESKGWVNSEGTAIQHTVYDRNPDMKLSAYTYSTKNLEETYYSEDDVDDTELVSKFIDDNDTNV